VIREDLRESLQEYKLEVTYARDGKSWSKVQSGFINGDDDLRIEIEVTPDVKSLKATFVRLS
jgi:hypothetical protein